MTFYKFVTGASQAIIAFSLFNMANIIYDSSIKFDNTLDVFKTELKKSTKILEQIQEDRKKRCV